MVRTAHLACSSTTRNNVDEGAVTGTVTTGVASFTSSSAGGVSGTAGPTSTTGSGSITSSGSGPTDGCYSVTGWAPCDDQWSHITDSPTGRSSEWWTFSFRQGSVGFTPFSADVRCVLDL